MNWPKPDVRPNFHCKYDRSLDARDYVINERQFSILGSVEKSVLLLEVGGSSGSGCFVRVNGERFILTCAHVVANAKVTSI